MINQAKTQNKITHRQQQNKAPHSTYIQMKQKTKIIKDIEVKYEILKDSVHQ